MARPPNVNPVERREFFKDPDQLEYLVRSALPELVKTMGAGVRRKLMVWCPGCGTGEEPYTVGLLLHQFGCRFPGFGFHYEILGTDPERKLLEIARVGVYPEELTEKLPENVRANGLLRSRDRSRALVRVSPDVRSCISFRQLSPAEEEVTLRESVDIIFWRSGFSSLDVDLREYLLDRFYEMMPRGGFVFLGQDDSPPETENVFSRTGPGIYRKLA